MAYGLEEQVIEALEPLNTRLEPQHEVRVAFLCLHTGLVVIGVVGSGTRQEVLAMGDTPNIAGPYPRARRVPYSSTQGHNGTSGAGALFSTCHGPTLAMGRCRHVKLNKLDQTLAGGHEALRLAHALAYPPTPW
jgi:hypothetical protein